MAYLKIPGIEKKFSDSILELFQSLPAGCEIILFGSRSKGNYREGSDIDLALKGPAVSLEDRGRLLARYEDLYLPWKLDLVIYDLITDPALKNHIDRYGRLLLTRE
jgi:predicted nucleotidyltransferase